MQPQQPPYQQQPAPMQPVQPKKKRTIYDYLTWAMIAAGSVLAISLIAWAVIYFTGKTSSDTGKTQRGVAATLESDSTAPQLRTISSQLGVKIPYDSRELEGFGFADDTTFANTDLDEARPYTVMRVRPVETSEATRNEVTLESPELRVTSSLSKGYWDLLATKKEYKDLSKIDILVKETVQAHEKDKTVESSDAEVKNIGDVDYRKVTFTSKNELYGVTTERKEDCYMTVQHDRPYVACINGIRASNFAVVPQLESVLTAIKYEGLDSKLLVDTAVDDANAAAMPDSKDDEKIAATDKTSKEEDTSDEETKKTTTTQVAKTVPSYLSATQDFKTMAAAAPAIVRVGTVYCADIKLSLPEGGDGPTLTGACVDKAGTGFFVSRDGYIATSASTVQVKPQEAIAAYITNAPDSSQALVRLQRILDYLVESRSIMQTDADALMAGAEERDQDSIAKVNALGSLIAPEDIAITKEKYGYAVQLADKPIVVNQNGDGSSSFAYTDTVIEAAIEAKDYSANLTQQQIYNGDVVTSDTALLKTKKSATYPTLRLALSGEGGAEKSTVDIAGMPMYAVGSLASAQFRATPLYRSGQVSQTFSGGEGQKVRSISTSSHAGLAGAPAMDQSANVIGMATYNNLNCPDRKCFASTVIRDTVGITELAKQRNITLLSSSSSSTVWNEGINQLTKGNYRQATQLFNEASQLYPQNYMAARFADYSKSQYGTATDTSTMNSVVSLLQALAAMMGGVLVLLVIALLVLKMIIRPHTETQYGQMAHGSYIDPSQWQHQTLAPSAHPGQTVAPLGTVPQPAQWQQSQPVQPQQPVATPQTGWTSQPPAQSATPPAAPLTAPPQTPVVSQPAPESPPPQYPQ